MWLSLLGALLPIAAVLVLMLRFRWGADRAGLAGWLAALVIAVAGFGAGASVLAVAHLKAVLLALYVLYIIWMALLFYHALNEAGVIQTIGHGLSALVSDRCLQSLILGWTFGSFLQGIAGYGVPTAVVAPLLIGLGMAPVTAVVVAGIGHAWAVTFGSLAASFHALVAATGRAPADLAPPAALFLGVAALGCGFAVLWATGGPRALGRYLLPVLIIGLTMAGVQYGLALAGLYTLAAVGAGLAGMAVAVVVARWYQQRATRALGSLPPESAAEAARAAPRESPRTLLLALLPYLLLIAIVGAAELIPPLSEVLDSVVLRLKFPAVATGLGYVTPAETGRTISLFGHPGALLAYTAGLMMLLFYRLGRYQPGAGRRIVQRTLKGALKPSIGILAMVAMAVVMEHAGMTFRLAAGLAEATGAAFPVVSPFIGVLGAFMTGSNTNSNVMFAALQQEAANILSISPLVILAAQTTGGAIGGAFAPAKVIVGCSTVGLAGQEAGVLRATLAYGVVIVVIAALMALVLA